MLAAAASAAVLGIDAIDVLVEVHVANGLPQWTLVGLAATAVKESRDRVQAALANSGFVVPARRTTISLTPGELPKQGTGFDLPIALAVLAASGQVPPESLVQVCAVGELGLDGLLRAVRGTLAVARHVAATGEALLIVPPDNLIEARRVPGVRIIAPRTLADLVEALRAGAGNHEAVLQYAATHWPSAVASGRDTPASGLAPPLRPPPALSLTSSLTSSLAWSDESLDLADVVGQALAVRALEIAAAGSHNLLLVGPPGAGKTMLARRLPGILPPLEEHEALEVLAIHSVAGTLDPARAALTATTRPFRAPHHSISTAGLIGGGSWPRPGEVSLAHLGVLFLDELSLFPRHTLEALRQPLEDGHVAVVRAARAVGFPARFALIAASNPCPCGYAGCDDRPCRCTVVELERHRARLSGPLADRIDLHITMHRVDVTALARAPSAPGDESTPGGLTTGLTTCLTTGLTTCLTTSTSADIRQRVLRARARQRRRYASVGALTNASAPARLIAPMARLAPDARALLVRAGERLRLSARAYHRVLRVARTIADLEDTEVIGTVHVAESLRYRPAGAELGSGAEEELRDRAGHLL